MHHGIVVDYGYHHSSPYLITIWLLKKTSDDTPQKMLITMLRPVLQILESVIVPELGIEIMAI